MANSNFLSSLYPPPPEDLTNFIVKYEEQYREAGNFGDVYRCLYNGSLGAKQVAVKAFRFRFRVDNDTGMARRELGIWRRLDHPNIVPFLGITTGFGVAGSKSLVSLWMPNGTLQSFLDEHENLGVDHRLRLLLDIANGLHYLHSFTLTISSTRVPKPIFHGDLNPANVLLDHDYTARLIDFGYASMMGDIPEGLTYLKRSTTKPGALRWVAPEHVSSTSDVVCRTTQSDVYSFGCIALQVLSGKQPWSELGEDVAVVLKLSQGHMPSRPDSMPIDDQYWELIEYCWSVIPDRRPTATIIVSSIKQFLENFPYSQPLRNVISSSSVRSRPQLDASDLPSFTSLVGPGDRAGNAVVGINSRDQHVSDGLSFPRQSNYLSESISNDVGVGQPPSTPSSETATRGEGCTTSPAPKKGLPSLWINRIPRGYQ